MCFAFALVGAVGAISSYIAIVHSTGWTDAQLARADAMLGFNWLDTYSATVRIPKLEKILQFFYFTCFYTPFVVFALLSVTNSYDRLYRFHIGYGLSLALTTFIFWFFPAEAAFAYFLPKDTEVAGNVAHYSAAIAGLRDGSLRLIDPFDLAGIISFPSFHATMAIMFAWATWHINWTRIPTSMLNGAMWASAIPIGGHYLVDLIGGTILAFVGIIVARNIRTPTANTATFRIPPFASA